MNTKESHQRHKTHICCLGQIRGGHSQNPIKHVIAILNEIVVIILINLLAIVAILNETQKNLSFTNLSTNDQVLDRCLFGRNCE